MLKVVASLFLVVIAFNGQLAQAKSRLTPLAIDNYPCKPEVLKKQVRYICDSKGNVTCNHGWSDGNGTQVDPMHPCKVPVCSQGCVQGKCRRPNTCACNIGWEGDDCSKCVTLPGCVHGSCDGSALACVCHNSTLWSGGLCDVPVCADGCTNGKCIAPGVCKCNPGWTGANCSQCVPLQGCSPIGGFCQDPNNPAIQTPHGCTCKSDYTGPLCDQPKCNPGCVQGHGNCVFARNNMTEPICKCNIGYSGTNCADCITYPGCPQPANLGGCSEPFQCKCDNGASNHTWPCNAHDRDAW